MSNDISYVIKVVDDFSANIKKFQVDITVATKAADKAQKSLDQTSKTSKFFTQNLRDLGKAAGLYMGFQQIKQFGKEVFNTRIQMDSMSASLSAILPKFDKSKSGVQLASEEMEYLRGVTNKLGVSFETALPNYMQFLAGSKDNLETTRKTFEAFAGLSRMYGLDNQRFGLVINALSQMQSKGVVSMEELRQQLGDSLPGALKLFADAAGMSTAQFTKLVAEGRIGSGIIKVVGENITKLYGQDIANASETLGAKTAVLGNEWLRFKDVLGKEFAPAMAGTVAGLTDGIVATTGFFEAINNQTAFSKLDEDMQGAITALRIMKGLMEGVGSIVEGFGILGEAAWTLGSPSGKKKKRLSSGLKEEAPKDALSQLTTQDPYSSARTPPQKIELEINHVNAPKGTTVEVKRSSVTNLRVGNTVGINQGGAF